MRSIYVLIAGLFVAVLGYIFLRYPGLPNGQPSTTPLSNESDVPGNKKPDPRLSPVPEIEASAEKTVRPKELVSSVYDHGLEYRQKAIAAAENLIQRYPVESYNRWRPIRVDPFAILDGGYFEEGAMPRTISVTPFPDVSFVADQTGYTVLEDSYAAIWTGKIRGSDNGQIRVSILAVFEIPTFVILVSDHPGTTIRISPATDNPTISPDMYMAVEVNPHLNQSLD